VDLLCTFVHQIKQVQDLTLGCWSWCCCCCCWCSPYKFV